MKTAQELKTRLRGLPRWLLWCLGAFPIAYGTYVVSVALFLNAGGVEMLGAALDDVEMSVESGSSWVPGVFVVSGAKFRARDYDIDLSIVADEATLSWAPLATFEKTLEFDELRASGVSFRLLHRVQDTPRQRKRVTHFPDLSRRGPFYQEERPPFSPMPFRVRLSHIEADLTEVWISEYRTEGTISAAGALTIDDEFEVLGARISLEDGSVFVGDRQAISGSNCRIAASVGPFALRDAGVHAVFETIDGEGMCKAKLEDLSIVDIYVLERPLDVSGTGRVTADMRIKAGLIVDTRIETEVELRELRIGRGRVAGSARALIESDAEGQVRFRVEQEKGHSLGDGVELLAFEDLAAELTLGKSVVTRPRISTFKVSVRDFSHGDDSLFPELIFPDLPNFTTADSDFELSGSLKESERSGFCMDVNTHGFALLHISEGRRVACQQALDLQCEGKADGSTCTFHRASCQDGELRLSGDVRVPFSVWATEARLSVDDEGAWDADIPLAGDNPKEALHVLVGDGPLEKMGVSLLPLGPVSGRLKLSQAAGAAGSPVLGYVTSLKTGALSGRGRFVVDEGFSSRFLVQSGPMTAGVEQNERGVRVHPLAGEDFLEEE